MEHFDIVIKYQADGDFKEYVDNYCKKHHKSVEEALKDSLVISYLNYLIENKK